MNDFLEKLKNITRATTNLELAQSEDIVFYHLAEGDRAEEQFKKRLLLACPGLLILNREPGFDLGHPYKVFSNDMIPNIQKIVCDHLYPFPENLKLVGITGTNGKTSVVTLASQLTILLGKKAFALGTLGLSNGREIVEETGHTTPSYVELRRLLFLHCLDADVLFMEVSSHALVQGRLNDLKLDHAAWTNFTQDHLDYHQSMEAYFEAKCLIATRYLKRSGKLVTSEGDLSEKILRHNEIKNQIVVARNKEKFKIENSSVTFDIGFNKKNLELALELIDQVFGDYPKNIASLLPPPGRFTLFKVEQRTVVVDYAHTPDALRNVLQGARDTFQGRAICVVFGCGGDRDRSKRELMGKIAQEMADWVIVTSDNPRTENPESIMIEIEKGVTKPHQKIGDRILAIKTAIAWGPNDSVVVIAGKGHEDYQEVMGVKIPYSDLETVVNLGGKSS
jgi:UDP-N-acetylmuramoyl-L-alanyl-D-glutamate--2,6-diaminopimelate ligase